VPLIFSLGFIIAPVMEVFRSFGDQQQLGGRLELSPLGLYLRELFCFYRSFLFHLINLIMIKKK
jgi:hypothetical protein